MNAIYVVGAIRKDGSFVAIREDTHFTDLMDAREAASFMAIRTERRAIIFKAIEEVKPRMDVIVTEVDA